MKSKILFLVHLAPPVHGAATICGYVKDSVLINSSFDCKFINLASAGSLSDIGKWNFKKVLVILQLWFTVLKTTVTGKYQLCYMTINAKGGAWYKELVTVAILKLFSVPIVYHFHNKGVEENSNTRFKKLLYLFQFNKTKSIVISPLLYPDIKKLVPPADVYYCPNGITALALNKKDTILTPKTTLKNEPVKILFLSNLIESKGVYVLLEACSLLQKKSIPFNCIFIGGESDITAADFNSKVKYLNLQTNVSYQGKKYGLEKQIAFSEADIFAFPTYYHNETFGLVIVEAMQQALPVVSTFEGGVPDVVADNISGFLVPQQNAKALAEKLELLIQNPNLRSEMGNAGKKLYQEKFTIEIFEKKILEILSDALLKFKK